MMNWELCIICGGGGDLKCPAGSHQKNGLEVYSSFLDVVKEYENLLCTPCDMTSKVRVVQKLLWSTKLNGTRHVT